MELGDGQAMVVLEVEMFTISGSVLIRQADAEGQDVSQLPVSNPDVRRIAAKLEAQLVQPVGSLGQGQFGHVTGIWHMLRPLRSESGEWTADHFRPIPPLSAATTGDFDDVHYCYMDEDRCRLGYNPMKQICQPRPVGWISTYSAAGRIPHIAPYLLRRTITTMAQMHTDFTDIMYNVHSTHIIIPLAHSIHLHIIIAQNHSARSRYSFFSDVGRGQRPMVRDTHTYHLLSHFSIQNNNQVMVRYALGGLQCLASQ